MVPWANPSPQPKWNLDRSSVFAGLTSVTDRPIDHDTRSVTIGRIYVRSTTMMRPNNNKLKSNLTTGRIAAAYGRFIGICQVSPVCTPPNTCFFGPPEFTTQTVSQSIQPFLGDRLLSGSPYAIGPLSVLSVGLSCLSVTLVYCDQTVG